ncbi:10009_t:CDS:2 [Gigaspora margarita]|uniref:10009_t:CDS:1 n=1 Tax=Gigaspora margarita TaxID=4874 RepID=A0ABN7UYP1_GIGMA|nr:10009_t:CDS:2 [Gigaspora margarita]
MPFQELDKLKERIDNLKKKVNGNPNSLKKLGENIDTNLEEIKKYLEGSEEILKREAQEQPKIQTSYDNLKKSITELEAEIKDLEIQYKALETKTHNLKVKYAVGGVIAGIHMTGITNKDILITRVKRGISEEKRLVGKILGQVKSAKKNPQAQLNIEEKQLRAHLNEIIKK